MKKFNYFVKIFKIVKIGFRYMVVKPGMEFPFLRGCPHITSAAGGGEGVSQMLTIADEGGWSERKI